MLRTRSLLGGANAALSLILLAGLLAAVNYLANRHHLRRDLTANRTYSLADQTRRVLEELDRDVQVIAFYRAGDAAAEPIEDLLKEYADLSPRLRYEIVDPDRQPGRARRYPDVTYGVTVIDAGERTERMDGADEEALTNALIKVTRAEKKRIGFVSGHGEHDPTTTDEGGYSALRTRLEDQGYEVEVVNLAPVTAVPAGFRVLVLAGAKKALLPNERQAIAAFLAGGGSALVLADPDPGVAEADLVAPYGVELGDDLIVDVSGVGRLFGADEFLPMGLEYRTHPLTERFNLTTLYPQARSVRAAAAPPAGTEVDELVFTAPASWAEASPDRRPVLLDEKDRQGPVCVLVAAARPVAGDSAASGGERRRDARLVVAGDSDFCSNGYASFGGNLDLALNALSWLAEDEGLIAIRPRDREDRRVLLTEGQAMATGSILILGLPLAAVAAGIVVWWRRR